MHPAFPALVAALALSACAEPAVRADTNDLLAEGVMPDELALLERAPAPPAPTPLPPAPPPRDSAVVAKIARVDRTTEPGAGIFDFVGVYHGGEAPAADGERWLGLYPTTAGWTLDAVTVYVRTVPDPLFSRPDAAEDPPTGAEVTTDQTTRSSERHWSGDELSDTGRFFVRADGLTPGPVATAFSGHWSFEPGASLAMRLPGDDSPHRLKAVPVNGRPYEVLLELDGHPVLHHVDRDAGYASLLWAGDLDRDGALDLVLNASPHYNLSVLQLWLSSAADSGAPLGLAAEHRATGC